MTLRERCERLYKHFRIHASSLPLSEAIEQDIAAVETFAREIRNEALEEAAHAIVCTPKYPLSDHDAHERALDRVLALKDNVGQFTSSEQKL